VRFGDHSLLCLQELSIRRLTRPHSRDALRNMIRSFSRPITRSTQFNFKPVDLSSALGVLDAPYLPLVIQEAAACRLTFVCGAEAHFQAVCWRVLWLRRRSGARRFNRMLIDAD